MNTKGLLWTEPSKRERKGRWEPEEMEDTIVKEIVREVRFVEYMRKFGGDGGDVWGQYRE